MFQRTIKGKGSIREQAIMVLRMFLNNRFGSSILLTRKGKGIVFDIALNGRLSHSALVDRVVETATRLIEDGFISTGSGPAAPCFDEFDYAVESKRGSWYTVDARPFSDLKEAVAALKKR